MKLQCPNLGSLAPSGVYWRLLRLYGATKPKERRFEDLKLLKHTNSKANKIWMRWSGCGQMVSVLAIYSVDASSNHAEVYSLNSVNCSKIKKINEKRPVKVEFG